MVDFIENIPRMFSDDFEQRLKKIRFQSFLSSPPLKHMAKSNTKKCLKSSIWGLVWCWQLVLKRLTRFESVNEDVYEIGRIVIKEDKSVIIK